MLSGQIASLVDLAMGVALFSLVGLDSSVATAIGAFMGGVVNCVINYFFTFTDDNSKLRSVAFKYATVWVGSLLLNTFGTTWLFGLLGSMSVLDGFGITRDGFYAIARVVASILVSWFWNFPLQRYFVYRDLEIKERIHNHRNK